MPAANAREKLTQASPYGRARCIDRLLRCTSSTLARERGGERRRGGEPSHGHATTIPTNARGSWTHDDNTAERRAISLDTDCVRDASLIAPYSAGVASSRRSIALFHHHHHYHFPTGSHTTTTRERIRTRVKLTNPLKHLRATPFLTGDGGPLTSPHLTSSHLTSPHLTTPHLTSPLSRGYYVIFRDESDGSGADAATTTRFVRSRSPSCV
ncbi:hypothetical protein ALC57_05914 [Trachymyrmex cornetzi]|uniref:Uncharacterized protein n=1 Tax=Trachymyrmex cornetzi TaxID=471704 RepID=A0A151J9R1_9HYME|nr:hypothetical protein ALC57_05914 [Trachymyrmex cornetzi]